MKKWIKFLGLFCFLCLFSHIAFSQTRWDSLGPRISRVWNTGPDVMYADSNYLYMAGWFLRIDSMHLQGIARWNGVKWDSMGKGIDGLQYDADTLPGEYPNNTWAITTYHNKLYVGGVFMSLGEVMAPCLGTWNGTAWEPIPIQPFTNNYYNIIHAMDVINNKLYIGGGFDTVAGQSGIFDIACWNDTNWSSLNFPNYGSLFEAIDAICEYNGSIYVGGTFYDSTLTDSTANILRYDGTKWHAVGGGIKGNADEVYSMVVYNGELYVAGYFSQADGNVGNNIQKWNGTAWSAVGGGTDNEIFNLLVYNGKLYAMGEVETAGGISTSRIAEWDGNKWCSLGSIFDNAIGTSCIYKDSLYIGGGFWTIDGDSISYIAEWTGGNYTSNCSEPTGVNQLKTDNEQLKVYPNPTNVNVTVQVDIGQAEKVEFTLYNLLGEPVYSDMENEPTGTINKHISLSSLPNGEYILQVIAGENVYHTKITKLQ